MSITTKDKRSEMYYLKNCSDEYKKANPVFIVDIKTRMETVIADGEWLLMNWLVGITSTGSEYQMSDLTLARYLSLSMR